MIVYFFAITYGIYLATILEFLFFSDIFFIESKKIELFDGYRARKPWDYFAVYIFFEKVQKKPS